MPGRATVFIRCAPGCIDSKFAQAVLSVYKKAEQVPADPAVPSDTVEAVRAALRRGEGGGVASHVNGKGVGGDPRLGGDN